MSEEREILIFTGGTRTDEEFELLDEERKSRLPVQRIKDSLHDFMQSMTDILPTVETAGGGYGLESLTVAVGINGKGQVGFLGTGGELGGTATLTLTFKPLQTHFGFHGGSCAWEAVSGR